ncbi:hypothetical protein ACKX2L_06170 [Lachnospiraceae bacterium YH-ros2228]
MTKNDFLTQAKKNTQKMRAELMEQDSPANDVFDDTKVTSNEDIKVTSDENTKVSPSEYNKVSSTEHMKMSSNENNKAAPDEHTKVSSDEHNKVSSPRRRRRKPTSPEQMAGRPMEDDSHEYRTYKEGETEEDTQYIYQIRVTAKNKFWLNTMAARKDQTVYEVVRQVFQTMIPEFNAEKTVITMEDYQPLNGGKQLTLYMTRQEIQDLKNGAKKKGLKLIHYVDKLLTLYRERYDKEFSDMAAFPEDMD